MRVACESVCSDALQKAWREGSVVAMLKFGDASEKLLEHDCPASILGLERIDRRLVKEVKGMNMSAQAEKE